MTKGKDYKIDAYEMIEVDRSKLLNATYNPRKITDKARKKLTNNLKTVGLLAPIIWNKRTGNIVGGHQRISIIDDLKGTKNYKINVACVDLDEKTEKEQNIFLNNTKAMGEYDQEALAKMFDDNLLDYANMGYDSRDIEDLLDIDVTALDVDDVAVRCDEWKEAKERRNLMKVSMANREDSQFYFAVVFKNEDERNRTLYNLGLECTNYIKASDFLDAIERITNEEDGDNG